MLTPNQKQQAKKLLLLKENPTLAILDELQELNLLLRELTGKEKLEIHANANFPKIPPFPEIPKTDLTQTNELLLTVIAGLNAVLAELKKDVTITLE